MHRLGASGLLELVDILSIDEQSGLDTVVRPVFALLLVLPTSEKYELRRATTKKMESRNLQHEELIWIEQTIDNACGLYALLHALCAAQLRGFISM